MKPANTKTLWKRETTAKQPQSEFDSIVRALATIADGALRENIDEILTVLQQESQDETGKTLELLNAVLNVLENLKLELVESQSGVAEILRDTATLLEEARSTAVLERESAKIDELLERLDFVASGGTDEEVPRSKDAECIAQPTSVIPTLPIERPPNFEDPWHVHHAERLSSLISILSANVQGTSGSERKQRLQLEQVTLADYFVRIAKLETTLSLQLFADELVKEICASLEKQTKQSVDFVNGNAADGYMYRSLAEMFRRKLCKLAVLIGTELMAHPDSTVHFEIDSSQSNISIDIKFVGLRTAFDLISQRMDELSLIQEDIPVLELDAHFEEALSKRAKTRKERIAQALVEIQQFVDNARGQLRMSSDDDDQLDVTVDLPLGARVLQTLPFVIGSDTFLLESHLITAIVDSTKVHWDDSHTRINYEDHSYEYSLIEDATNPVKPNSGRTTWMLLLDTTNRKLALEVESIGEPELHLSVPSISEIHHGHKLVGGSTLKLLIEPVELRLKGASKNNANDDLVANNHLLCCNVSQSLVDKICRCIDSKEVVIRNTSSLSETLTQLQEFQPDYLVIEDRSDEFRAVDAVKRIAHTFPTLRVAVLLFTEASDQPVEQMKNGSITLKCLAKDVDFRELKKALVVSSNSAISVSESEHD